MRTADFDYALPPELIAQRPIEPRDHARLLVTRRGDGSLEHRRFFDLPALLQPGDLLVANDSRVIPARLRTRKSTGGAVELLLLRRTEAGWWLTLARPSRRLRPGTMVSVEGGGRVYEIEIGARRDDGLFEARLEDEALIEACGEAPLPPYIHEPLADPERYQTVYAREEGSAAAPTAGLHFTPRLMERLAARGVDVAYVTLHVGLDTFRPVEADDPREHHIHTEYAVLPPETARAIARAREHGGRVVAVGTTSVRVLESAAQGSSELRRSLPRRHWADDLARPRVPRRRRHDYELPPAPLDAADAGERLRRQGPHRRRVRRGRPRAVPLLFVRRRYAASVGGRHVPCGGMYTSAMTNPGPVSVVVYSDYI